MTPSGQQWWRTAVLYQIYPRSFADSNADGVGDIPGIIEHLDHLQWLGVDGIWLSPVTVSPNADWGYDVSDFCAIALEFGTFADFDRLVTAAGERGIRVLLDIVPNHTSDQHPWFVDSRSSRTAAHREWYVWADAKEGGDPPNNWVSSFGGPGWTLDETTGQYFFHNHLEEQPDLNWWNDEVRDTFDGIFRFWSDRGVAGFRIDVCNVIIKDAELRDNPPATEDDDFETQMFGQRSVYNANRPEVHEVIRRWRRLADSYDEPRLLIGETPVPVDKLAEFYGDGTDELGLAFNFNFINAPFRAADMRAVVEETEAALPPGRGRRGRGRTTTCSASRPAGPRTTRPRSAWRCSCCSASAAPRSSTRVTRSAWGTSTLERDDLRDPLGVRFYPYYAGATPAAPRCSGPIGGAVASRTVNGPGCRSAMSPPPMWPRSGRTAIRSSRSAGT